MTQPRGYQEALAALEERGYGIKPGLERMEQLVRLLDNPQLTYPTIHIAGTNGKTSTARISGAVLAGHGLKTGVYTSPHLQTIRERFILSGLEEGKVVSELISEEEFAATLNYLAPFVEVVEGREGAGSSGQQDASCVTYFELATLAAFEWMAEKAVAAGVFEAGLGGRWDATNVIEGEVAVLTPIGVDHTEYLGSTPLEQAGEKVGIVKMGSSVVCAPQIPEVLELIERTAASREARMVLLGRDVRIEEDTPGVAGRLVSISTERGVYRDVYLPLYGPHQAQNLALAIAAAESFREQQLDQDALQSAVEGLTIPGRLEIVGRNPLVLLDGAHNATGAKALAGAIREAFPTLSITMVVTIFNDKDASAILGQLAPLAKRLYLTRSSSPRSADPQDLAVVAAGTGASLTVIESLGRAVDEAISTSSKEDMVLITGSLYGVGEARGHLLPGTLPEPQA